MFAESNGPLGSVQRAADAIRDSTSKDAEPNALRNVRLALLSLPRDSSNVPDVPEVRKLRYTAFNFGMCACGLTLEIARFCGFSAGYQGGD